MLVDEWSQSATPAGGEPWPGEAKATFEWLKGSQLLLERSTVAMPGPTGVSRRSPGHLAMQEHNPRRRALRQTLMYVGAEPRPASGSLRSATG